MAEEEEAAAVVAAEMVEEPPSEVSVGKVLVGLAVVPYKYPAT